MLLENCTVELYGKVVHSGRQSLVTPTLNGFTSQLLNSSEIHSNLQPIHPINRLVFLYFLRLLNGYNERDIL